MYNKKGFTLIEILVVATIIGLLAGIGAVSYVTLNKSSRDARRKGDLEQLRAAVELYKSNVGTYPTTTNVWYGECSGAQSVQSAYVPGLVAGNYITVLPRDPKHGLATITGCTGSSTCYMYRSNGTDYKIKANCGYESAVNTSDPYYDPADADAFQVSSSATSRGW